MLIKYSKGLYVILAVFLLTLSACSKVETPVVVSPVEKKESVEPAKMVEQSQRPAQEEVKKTVQASFEEEKENTDGEAVKSPEAAHTKQEGIKPASPEMVKEAEQLYNKGFQVYLSRKYDEAIKHFDMAIQRDPNCYMAYNGKGIALCFKGSFSDGMALIKKSLEIRQDFPYANFNMALAYKLQKDYGQALTWFDKAISYDSGNTWSYFGKACIYAEWNDRLRAVENLKKAIETDPGVKEIAKSEHDLDNIKSMPEFIELVK